MNSNQNKILLAVDGSSQSLEAVRYVGNIFASQEIEIVLFHVLSTIPEFFYDLGEDLEFRRGVTTIVGFGIALNESISKFMSEARQVLIDAGIPPEAISINIHERVSGIARDLIVESTHKYSAVIVGRNGLNRINDFVVGSIANKLLEKLLHVSICVVGGKPEPRKMILALDQSEGSMQAVDYVGRMLGGSSVELTLFHAVRGLGVIEKRFSPMPNLVHEKETADAHEMDAVFEKARTRLIHAGFDPEHLATKVVKGVSSRAGAIVQEAKKGGYGTIIVGRRGLSKVYEFLMGRVSNKVIQLARDHAVWVVS